MKPGKGVGPYEDAKAAAKAFRPVKNRPHAVSIQGDSRTEQSHKDDCDVNIIMARAMSGQAVDHFREHGGQYGDIDPVYYDEACLAIAQANTMFEELPAKVRNYFENDPAKFLKCAQDPNRVDEMRDLGLAEPLPEGTDLNDLPSLSNQGSASDPLPVGQGSELASGDHPPAGGQGGEPA